MHLFRYSIKGTGWHFCSPYVQFEVRLREESNVVGLGRLLVIVLGVWLSANYLPGDQLLLRSASLVIEYKEL